MTHISPSEMDSIAAILWAGMPICRYELAFDIASSDDVGYGLSVIDKLQGDRVIAIQPIQGHPMVVGMAQCVLCRWCPVHSPVPHGEHSTAHTVLPPHYYMPEAPRP